MVYQNYNEIVTSNYITNFYIGNTDCSSAGYDVGVNYYAGWYTYKKPKNAKFICIYGAGGGAGGGGGSTANTGTATGGGGAGGGGGLGYLFVPAYQLPNTLYIRPGDGGAGGLGLVNAGSGTGGTNGFRGTPSFVTVYNGDMWATSIDSEFGLFRMGPFRYNGNSNGAPYASFAGGTQPAQSGNDGYPLDSGNFAGQTDTAYGITKKVYSTLAGQAGSMTTPGAIGQAGKATNGGGGGAGITAIGTEYNGGYPNVIGTLYTTTTLGLSAAGPGADGQAGYNYGVTPWSLFNNIGAYNYISMFSGGGGGGSKLNGNAGNGGPGALGCGGGGGGAAQGTGVKAGNGGNGGPGWIYIKTIL